jgi:membrane protease YdiL (CAAX protease family)
MLEAPMPEPPVLRPPTLEPSVVEPPGLEPPGLEPPVLEPPAGASTGLDAPTDPEVRLIGPGVPTPPVAGWSGAPFPVGPQWKTAVPAAGGPMSVAAVPRRTHRWGLGAYLFVELVFLLASAAVGVLVVGDGVPKAWTLAVALAVPTLLAAGLSVLITRWRGNGPWTDLRLYWSWRDVRLGLAYGLGGLFVTLPASMLYMSIVGPDATSAVGEVFGEVQASWSLAVLIFLVVVFIAPLCEEIVYRGLLWGAVERHSARPWVALVVTTLLFALAHFEFTRTPLLLVVAIPIALARLMTGGLLASIVAHQVNNLLPGIALMLGLVGVIPMT